MKGGISPLGAIVQVELYRVAVPLAVEAEGRCAEQAAALARAAGAGVRAGGRRSVDAIANTARGGRGREGVLSLSDAASEDGKPGDQGGAAGP